MQQTNKDLKYLYQNFVLELFLLLDIIYNDDNFFLMLFFQRVGLSLARRTVHLFLGDSFWGRSPIFSSLKSVAENQPGAGTVSSSFT